MISESFIKFRQAVGKLCTIPFRESAHSPTLTLLLFTRKWFYGFFHWNLSTSQQTIRRVELTVAETGKGKIS